MTATGTRVAQGPSTATPTSATTTSTTPIRGGPRRVPSAATVWLWAWVAVGAGLRLWALGSRPLNLDESYEALTSRRPLGSLVPFLAHYDNAPPLTYLLRSPFLALGATNTMARLPSALCSIAALALFAFWMRRRGLLGLVAVMLLAVDGFQVHYGREARMYALLGLIGIAMAMTCEAWLRAPKRVHVALVVGLGLAAVFTHLEGFFLLAGVLTLPGLRRDRAAWTWRVAVVVPGVVFAVTWGWAFVNQLFHDHQPGLHTSPRAVVDVLGALVTSTPAIRGLAVVALGAGGVLLVRRHGLLGRTWTACFLVPCALTFVVATRVDILFARTFAYGAWAPIVAVAALVDAAAARRALLGVIAAVVALLAVLPTGVDAPGWTGPATRAVVELRHVARAGDTVVVRPFWLGYLVEWNVGARTPVLTLPDTVGGIPDAHATRIAGARSTGRVWLLEPVDAQWQATGWQSCAPPWTDGVTSIRCLASGP